MHALWRRERKLTTQGFVAQFATTTNAAGERILSAPVLSAIGTIQSVGQIIGMTSLPLWADLLCIVWQR